MNYIKQNDLKIDQTLLDFINKEVIPQTNIKSDSFWNKFANVVHELAPINKSLIEKRKIIQKKLMNGIKRTRVRILIRRSIQTF